MRRIVAVKISEVPLLGGIISLSCNVGGLPDHVFGHLNGNLLTHYLYPELFADIDSKLFLRHAERESIIFV